MLGKRDQHLEAGRAGAVLDFLQVGWLASNGFGELRLSQSARLPQARDVGADDKQQGLGVGVEGHADRVRLSVLSLKHPVRMC